MCREWLAGEGRGDEEPEADVTTWDAAFDLACAPAVPQAPLPPLPQTSTSPPLGCPATPPSTSLRPASDRPPTTGLGEPCPARRLPWSLQLLTDADGCFIENGAWQLHHVLGLKHAVAEVSGQCGLMS